MNQKLSKEFIQDRTTVNGKKIKLNQFSWDENSMTFKCNLSGVKFEEKHSLDNCDCITFYVKQNCKIYAGAGLLFSYTYHIRRCPTVAYNSSWNMFDTEKEISDYRNNLNRFFLEEVLLKRRICIRNNLRDLSHFFCKFATRKYERKLLKELIIKQHFILSSTNFYYCCNKPENMKKMIKIIHQKF